MSASDLTTYISAQRASGASDASIRNALLAKGWPASEVQEAFGSRMHPVSLSAAARPPRTSRKIALTFALVALTGAYALWQVFGTDTSSAAILPNVAASTNPSTGSQPSTQPQTAPTATPSSQPSSSSSNTPSSTGSAPAASPQPKPKGQYADGTYTGSVANAYYGNVQVQAIVQGGKITNVKFLQYPYTHSTSVYINQQAMPYLNQEAVQAQSAQVNGVSGATFTSEAFVQSLSSALTKAKNAY